MYDRISLNGIIFFLLMHSKLKSFSWSSQNINADEVEKKVPPFGINCWGNFDYVTWQCGNWPHFQLAETCRKIRKKSCKIQYSMVWWLPSRSSWVTNLMLNCFLLIEKKWKFATHPCGLPIWNFWRDNSNEGIEETEINEEIKKAEKCRKFDNIANNEACIIIYVLIRMFLVSFHK